MRPVAPTGKQYVIRRGSARATIVEVGGGLRTLDVDDRGVIAGFDVNEMAPAGHGQVLIPWPNRIADGRYGWSGATHQLAINEVDRSTAIHGLVRFASWSPVAVHDDRVELEHWLWPTPGYPFTLHIRISYHLAESGLVVTTTTRNAGTEPAPYGAGQHPYLQPPSGVRVDRCSLTVPAGRVLTTDDRGIPIETRAVAGSPVDFRSGREIGTTVLDTAFTQLARDAHGRATVELSGASGRSVTVWMDQGYRYVQVFTGDTLPADIRRRSVAVEPMTCPPNAFVTGLDLLRLEPDQTLTTSWGISWR